MSDLQACMAENAGILDAFLSEFLSTENPNLTELYAAMRYSVMAGGKRLRPFLTLQACKFCGGEEKDALFYAAALEMVHTYSLIHDDLPAMDNDDLRRGKPTNHKVFGEATAILAGDGLLTAAFELIARAPLTPSQNARAVAVLASAAGPDGMVGGQIMDLAAETHQPEFGTLLDCYALKTAALFRASVQLGAIAAGKDEQDEIFRSLVYFAGNLGLAFQLRDDILDEYGTEEELGKKTGSDRKEGKTTVLTHLSEQEAEELIVSMTQNGVSTISAYPNHDLLAALADFLTERRK